MKARMLHTRRANGTHIWLVYDRTRSVRAASRKKAIELWEATHGKISVLCRIAGAIRLSEAAMAVADYQKEHLSKE